MVHGLKLVIYPVKDTAKAKKLYSTLLGVQPYVDSPYYIGFKLGDQELGLDPNGHKNGMTGPLTYWQVSDIKASLQLLVDAGATVLQPIKDVGYGKLIASVKDADGNTTALMQNPG